MNLDPLLASDPLRDSRQAIRDRYFEDEATVLADLLARVQLDAEQRRAISNHAADLVRRVRNQTSPTMMEAFLDEYGLSTDEGIGLMCLAEALLRVPDAETIDDLIEDKIAPSDWGAHIGKSSSPLVNASSWALMLTGRVLDDDPTKPAAALRRIMKRLGEPVVRVAVGRAMRILGSQFVLGETIEDGMRKAKPHEAKGYTYSYDMLGEAARTEEDARGFYDAYGRAIEHIAGAARGSIRDNPGISVKLSALHPRYESTHREAVDQVVVPRAAALARKAAAANIGFNIDAEEQDRLDLSLDVIERVLADDALAGWDGFGVVVQAYGRRAMPVLEHLYALAQRLDRRIMVRLVKGAYWDTEVKLTQELGDDGFPVFTRKVNTDVSYLACARMLMDMRDRIYPQFATHNAHSCAAVLAMAANDKDNWEFQRLHGMGESLHEIVKTEADIRCRIYAPVGAHKDLLAYLVRRLLENGANSSFVNQIIDADIDPATIARDPVDRAEANAPKRNPGIRRPAELFGPGRRNSQGVRIHEPAAVLGVLEAREVFAATTWAAQPILATDASQAGQPRDVTSPAEPDRIIGQVLDAAEVQVAAALDAAAIWDVPSAARAETLRGVADLYEQNAAELYAIATREAGKTLADAVAEVREAVDFLRYYAREASRLDAEGHKALGVFVCISPWNFPLAIFTGQIAAALAAGNGVIAKPAEQSPLIADFAVRLMHKAGVPRHALQCLPGDGATVGAALTSDARIAGVCFTGSTETAQRINTALAQNARPDAVLIAETGGLNAMIVDSTALPEQAVRDIVASAFQSAGQRCSALRMLYVQSEARERLMRMLFGAMDALTLGDPWQISTDVGPVIDAAARHEISRYIAEWEQAGQVIKSLGTPGQGRFVSPTVIAVPGIAALEREVFGPVLHVASFEADQIDAVVDAVNARGYGLTFGMHTRIDDRVQQVTERLHVGNIYVNRNQIGAIVGSQPFGGEGLSGTGPKAGGPHYVARFTKTAETPLTDAPQDPAVEDDLVQAAIDRLDMRAWAARPDRMAVLRRALAGAGTQVKTALNEAAGLETGPFDLPGPTGESNRLTMHPKGLILCLGPTGEAAMVQAAQALAAGCGVVMAAPGASGLAPELAAAGAPIERLDGTVRPKALEGLRGIAAVAALGISDWTRALRQALAARDGAIIPLETALIRPERFYVERHLCIDTTAAGGNASLLAAVD